MQIYTQPQLFADDELTGTGRPRPWAHLADEQPDDAAPVLQEQPPVDEDVA